MRRSDRVHGVAVIVAVVCLISIVPVAGAVGTTLYAAAVDRSARDAAVSHRSEAVLVADSRPDPGPNRAATATPAVWIHAGVEHRGHVRAPEDAVRGDRVAIWVSDTGDIVRAPKTGIEAAVEAVAAAIGICWAGIFFPTAVIGVLRYVADVHHSRSVDLEWRALSRT